jgi:predicted nucleic acid-binding protein
MASRAFLDANVLLDLTLKRDGFESAKTIVELAINGQVNLYTSSSIIHIVGYWLTKAYNIDQAKEILVALLDDVQVLETDHETVLQALQSSIIDIEDAIQYHTGVYHRMDKFITRDKILKKSSLPALPVQTPEEFLQ